MTPTRNTPRPKWRLAALALVSLTLTGCFDLLEEIWFLPDGSARVVFDVGLPKPLLNAARLKGEDPLEQFRQEAKATEEELKKDPDVKSFTFRDYEEGGQHHLVYDLTVSDPTRLNELHQRALERMNSSGEQEKKPGLNFRIEKQGFTGKYVFVQQLGEPKEAAPGSGAPRPPKQAGLDSAMKDFGKQLAQSMLGNHYFIVRVHGPSIEETNGKLNEQKDMVEWKHSLLELAEPSSEGTEMRAVVQAGLPLWVWPLVIGLPLLVLMLAVSAARRKRSAR